MFFEPVPLPNGRQVLLTTAEHGLAVASVSSSSNDEGGGWKVDRVLVEADQEENFVLLSCVPYGNVICAVSLERKRETHVIVVSDSDDVQCEKVPFFAEAAYYAVSLMEAETQQRWMRVAPQTWVSISDTGFNSHCWLFPATADSLELTAVEMVSGVTSPIVVACMETLELVCQGPCLVTLNNNSGHLYQPLAECPSHLVDVLRVFDQEHYVDTASGTFVLYDVHNHLIHFMSDATYAAVEGDGMWVDVDRNRCWVWNGCELVAYAWPAPALDAPKILSGYVRTVPWSDPSVLPRVVRTKPTQTLCITSADTAFDVLTGAAVVSGQFECEARKEEEEEDLTVVCQNLTLLCSTQHKSVTIFNKNLRGVLELHGTLVLPPGIDTNKDVLVFESNPVIVCLRIQEQWVAGNAMSGGLLQLIDKPPKAFVPLFMPPDSDVPLPPSFTAEASYAPQNSVQSVTLARFEENGVRVLFVHDRFG